MSIACRVLRAERACCLATLLLAAPAPGQTGSGPAGPDARQILWQRSLEDAVAIAQRDHRPILIAVNMDGESASERIVREEYRDPRFVASTRPFVCLVASVFRHTARDYDDDGRRIPCPRLGEVTCGEHAALEPVLFAKYLSDGERIAPRHALILQDGRKAWDLALQFDLHDIDRKVAEAAAEELRRRAAEGAARAGAGSAPTDDRTEAKARADARDHRGRLRFEETLAPPLAEPDATLRIAEPRAGGNTGSSDALRRLVGLAGGFSGAFRTQLVDCARTLHLEASLAEIVRSRVCGPGRNPGAVLPGGEEALLPMLRELDGASPKTRSLLLACETVAEYAPGHAPRFHLARALERAHAVTLRGSMPARAEFPLPQAIDETLADAATLERDLAARRQELRDAERAPDAQARGAKAALDLARRRVEDKQDGAEPLLAEAVRLYDAALAQRGDEYRWWIERARTAYFQGRYEDEARCGRAALAVARKDLSVASAPAPGTPAPEPLASETPASRPGADGEDEPAEDRALLLACRDAAVVEALRWIGDADARLLDQHAALGPAAQGAGMLEGARALACVAASAFGDETDWTSFASFYGALGLGREELAILQAAALRLPRSTLVRERLNAALWTGGRIDLAPAMAEQVAAVREAPPDAIWHAGYAWILAAENQRRGEAPDAAIAAYANAERRFRRAAELEPGFRNNSQHYVALSWLGRGFAHLLADRRAEAARCLVQGIAAKPAAAAVRDGLDREAVDLLDQALEWRESGPSPVAALDLLKELEDADPNGVFWAIAVADTELREALRADGRNPKKVAREETDAKGVKRQTLVGVPCEEGDAYLRTSIAAARRALRLDDTAESKRALAQSATTMAERLLERGLRDEARADLSVAAPLLGAAEPAQDADRAALEALAQRLRTTLGEARPRFRPGR